MDREIKSGRIDLGDNRLPAGWAVATSAKKKGVANGDGYQITRTKTGLAIAIADGSGSGQEARDAANNCLKRLECWNGGDIPGQLETVHENLRGGRGAAICLCHLELDHPSLTWAAVGDVQGLLCRANQDKHLHSVAQQGGTLGASLPRIRTQSIDLAGPTLIILATDGIKSQFRHDVPKDWGARAIARLIHERHRRSGDDATVLVVKVEA